MSNPKYISSEEFLTRAKMVSRSPNSSDMYANGNGGKLFVGPMENQYQVKNFFDKLNNRGVVVECEDNPTQKNYASTIKLTFNEPKNMLVVMSSILVRKPDEMHCVDDKTCILWWD